MAGSSKTRTGNIAYAPVLEFTDWPTCEAFSNAIVAAALKRAPAAFDAPEAVVA